MIPILDKNEESGIGGYVYGMNTVDEQRDLVQGECQLLENTVPGRRMTPRNAIVDLFTSTTAIGRGSEQTTYSPISVLMSNPDDEDYIFIWSQQNASTDTFLIESIKVSDGSRSVLMVAKFSSVETTCSMKKLYGSVYCLFSHSITENYTNQYLVNNIIIFWNTTTSAWDLRSWGIDYTPTMNAIVCVDSSGNDFLDERSGAAAVVLTSQVCLTMGTDGTRKQDVLLTSNMSLWDSKTVDPREYLTDGDGNIFDDEMYVPADWLGRDGHKMVYFQDKIWVMGGETSSGLMNDLWYTEDLGETWYRHITNCDWTARRDFAAVVFGGKIFLLGGYDVSGANDEVWSFDGTTWTEETTSGFSARYAHDAVVYDSKMWVSMGNGATDVINSTDGLTWSSITADASLGALENHAMITHDSKMWISGGYNGSTYSKSVHYSTDGITWTAATLTAAWTERSKHIFISFAGKMYVLTGYDGSNYLADTWYSDDGITWEAISTGLTKDKFYGYSFTIVRRKDSLCKLSSMTEYEYLPWETFNGRIITGPDEKLLTGTVSLSGTALTGSGTAFESELSTGDRIRIDGTFSYVTLVSVTDDTNAVVENDAGDSHTSKNFVIIPADGAFITTDEYNPGVEESPEISSIRQIVECSSTTDYGRAIIPLPTLDGAEELGGTHLRIRRTIGADTSAIAAGLDYLFLVDIAIVNGTYDDDNSYRDELSDDFQQTETHAIETNGYAITPFGRFATWDTERMWLSTGSGFWLYSVGASQDVEYPQKYASLYNGSTQRVVCDPEDGQVDTGAMVFDSDLYMFKDDKVFVLDSANPNNVPRDTANTIGCDFPNTLTYTENKSLGKCVLFLSNSGPAMLRSGGVVELLSRFKIKELWDEEYFHVDQDTGLTRSRSWKEKVSAHWFKNAWDIMVPGQDVPTIYSFFVDPKDNIMGSYISTLAYNGSSVYVNDPCVVIVKNDHIAYCVSNKLNVYRLSQYLKRGVYQDAFGGESFSYHQKMKSRARGFGQNYSIMGELSDAIIHCDLKDDAGLNVTAYCDTNRFNASMAYSEDVDTGLDSASYDDIRTMVQAILPEGCYGRFFSWLIDKTVPSDGDFSYSGIDMNVQPEAGFGPEFFGVASSRQNGWS